MTHADLSSAPFQIKQWVAERDIERPSLGRVKEIYWDDIAREWVMDVTLYSHTGERVGRESPRMGGPSSFEPCIPCSNWQRIAKPEFPLEVASRFIGDWRVAVDRLAREAQP